MFTKNSEDGYLEPVPGIKMKTLVWGDNSLLTKFYLEKGSNLPDHSHPNEQTGFMVSGKMKLFIGDDEFMVSPGDSWSIPGNKTHRAEVIEDSIAIEVFSPVREDYLPK